ncbi:MAG: hypothetical protein ACAH83_15765 [Alphaproteobacteria bacterium]
MLRKFSRSLTEHRLLYGFLAALAAGMYAGLEAATPHFYLANHARPPMNYSAGLYAFVFATFVTFWLGYSFIKVAGFGRSLFRRETLTPLRKPVSMAIAWLALIAVWILSVQHSPADVLLWLLVSAMWGVGAMAISSLLLSLAQFVRHGFNRQTAAFAKKPALLFVSLLGTVVFLGVFASMTPSSASAFVGY